MNTLNHRKEKIQKKRKQTPRREYLMEICSRYTFNMYRNSGHMSNYPPTKRLWWVLWKEEDLENNMFDLNAYNSVFENVEFLLKNNRLPWVSHYGDNENCDYATTVNNCKNMYLSSNLTGSQNVWYCYSIKYSSDIYNSVMVRDNASVVYDCFAVFRSHEIFYSSNITNSHHIWFSTNLVWCRECLYCSDLKNVSFHIHNKQYSEEEYFMLKKELLLKKDEFTSVTQSSILGYTPFTENVENGFATSYLKNWRNICFWWNPKGAENYYDWFSLWRWSDMYWWCDSWWTFSHIYCCSNIGKTTNAFYSIHLQACSYCFGCVGLKNKSYCIYNKQYTKEDRHEKVDEIFSQMEKEWTLGNFFPWSMSPFYFNDTAAYLLDDTFTKEEVEWTWYLWRDEKIKVDIPEWVEVISSDELMQYESFSSDWEREIDTDILKKVIQDKQWNYYRIMPMEYKFLKKYWLPLPREHWLTRIKSHFTLPSSHE